MTTTPQTPASPDRARPRIRRTIADAAGRATRFTDHSVEDAGIRDLLTTQAQWQAWLDVESALAQAQAEVGLIPRSAADAITRAAQVDLIDQEAVNTGIARTSHPLTPLIAELARLAGTEAGEYVHWGATTQNITQTGNNLLVKAAHRRISSLLDSCLSAAGHLAEREAETAMAGRTHGQHAVPITFGFKVATWIEELIDDRRRLQQAADDLATAMIGGAVGSYASLGDIGPEIERLAAAQLGLRPAALPSRAILGGFSDHMWAIAMLSATAAKIARDVMTMMQTETAEVSEPRSATSVGSSTMPQKQNPKLTYNIIEISARIRALVPITLEARIHSFEADGSSAQLMDETTVEALVATGDLLVRLHAILTGLTVDRARMRTNLDLTAGLISAEAVMLRLAQDIGRQSAHDIVLDLAAQAAANGTSLEETLLHDRRVNSHITGPELKEVLAPLHHLGLCANIAHSAAQRAATSEGEEVVGGARTRLS
ncbi:MAG: class-II fumarase/aspartase family protein [Nocardioides sp.]|uniref:class-II fumarase/aspartase family protein n=1 Tax=Nocardioides sp. TaxID=35761 RepID=UPI003D6C2959